MTLRQKFTQSKMALGMAIIVTGRLDYKHNAPYFGLNLTSFRLAVVSKNLSMF
jgi:hypothetical protein